MATTILNFMSLVICLQKFASFYFDFFQEIIENFLYSLTSLFFLWQKKKKKEYCLQKILNKIKIWYICKYFNKYLCFMTGL